MKIAIQGHPIRGHKVIQILKSLGGKNTEGLEGTYETFYYIDDKNEIGDDHKKNFPLTYKLYTLEEFEREFPFKVGDKVKTVSGKIGIVIDLIPGDNQPYYIKTDSGHWWCKPQAMQIYKEMKEERNITLTLDKAREWYSKGGELREIALQAFTEKELNSLPRSWKEFCTRYNTIKDDEHYIDVDSNLLRVNDMISNHNRLEIVDRNIYPSRKSAEAHLAMIQLEQLRNCWLDGWTPKWDVSEKWCIRLYKNQIHVGLCTDISRFLTFPTREMAEEFLKCFRNLIELAKDLI